MVKHRRVLLAVFLLGALALTSPRLRAQATEKALYVSVVDQAGAPVSDIGPTDLIVREDNLTREILRIAPANGPMQVAILIDNSQASSDWLFLVRRALPPLVDALVGSEATHDVAIVALASRPTILADYTHDRPRLQKGMDLVWPEPASAAYLLDGIIEVTKGFKRRDARRPVIIAITTDGPERSSRHYDQVLTALGESGAAFYSVLLGPPSTIMSQEEIDRDILLERGTRETGGYRERVLAGSALPGRLKQLADELTHRYHVTYARPQSLIPPKRVTVTTPRAGLTARGTPIRDPQGRP